MDTVVLPEYQGHRVGSQLIEARFNLIQDLNLRGLVAGSLMQDYWKVAAKVSVEQYVRDVAEGRRFDSNLSKQLHKGFKVHSLAPNYTVADSSLGWGVTIVWENPHYRPARHVHWPAPLRLPVRHPAAVLPLSGAGD